MWKYTELDVLETLQGVCTKLFTDVGVDRDTRKKRALAIRALGEVLLTAQPSGTNENEAKAAEGQFSGEDAQEHVMHALQTALQKATKDSQE